MVRMEKLFLSLSALSNGAMTDMFQAKALLINKPVKSFVTLFHVTKHNRYMEMCYMKNDRFWVKSVNSRLRQMPFRIPSTVQGFAP